MKGNLRENISVWNNSFLFSFLTEPVVTVYDNRNGKNTVTKMAFWQVKRICLRPFYSISVDKGFRSYLTLATKLLIQKHNMNTVTNGMGTPELILNAKNTDDKPVDRT